MFKKDKKLEAKVLNYEEERIKLIESKLIRLEKLLYFIALVSVSNAIEFVNKLLM